MTDKGTLVFMFWIVILIIILIAIGFIVIKCLKMILNEITEVKIGIRYSHAEMNAKLDKITQDNISKELTDNLKNNPLSNMKKYHT